MPRHDLYEQAKAAHKRHEREFNRYLDLLLELGPSDKQVIEQLARADEAMEAGRAAEAACNEAMNGEGSADN